MNLILKCYYYILVCLYNLFSIYVFIKLYIHMTAFVISFGVPVIFADLVYLGNRELF